MLLENKCIRLLHYMIKSSSLICYGFSHTLALLEDLYPDLSYCCQDIQLRTPLHLAVNGGKLEVFKYLMKKEVLQLKFNIISLQCFIEIQKLNINRQLQKLTFVCASKSTKLISSAKVSESRTAVPINVSLSCMYVCQIDTRIKIAASNQTFNEWSISLLIRTESNQVAEDPSLTKRSLEHPLYFYISLNVILNTSFYCQKPSCIVCYRPKKRPDHCSLTTCQVRIKKMKFFFLFSWPF